MHKQKVTRLGLRKSLFPKVTKMAYIIGHRIDYNGVVVLRCQQTLTQVTPELTGFLKRDYHITCLSTECRENKNRTTIKKI